MKTRRLGPGSLLAVVLILALGPLLYSIYITAYYGPSTVCQSTRHSRNSQYLIPEIKSTKNSQQKRLTPEEVGQRFQHRLQHFNQACLKFGNSSLFHRLPRSPRFDRLGAYQPLTNVSVDYCSIEKTASTTWGRFFQSIRRKMERLGVNKTQTVTNIKKITFLFVRDPYSRLLSAYVDKLFSPNSYFWVMGRYIVKNFRTNPSNFSLNCGHDVTFPEFIRYVVHSQETAKFRNAHFVPTHDHCALCTRNVSYDYIGHLETLNEDMPYLIKLMQSPVNYTTNFDSYTLFDNAHWVLNRMGSKLKKCMSMKEACLRLWKKWQVRGILSKKEPLPVTAREANVISARDFAGLALQALGRSGPKEQRKRQKAEALRDAFASVLLEDRRKLQEVLFLDFELFGFDPSPESVFPTRTTEFVDGNGYSYFDLNS